MVRDAATVPNDVTTGLPVLVVEDDPDHQSLIAELLKADSRDSITVEFAGSVEDACAAIQSARFAFVIVDHSLPDGSGIDVLERCEEHLLTTPVIGLSTSSDPEVAISDFRNGAIEFIKKHDAFRDGSLGRRVFDAVARHKRKSLAGAVESARMLSFIEGADDLVAAARTDALTGLPNRRTFDEFLNATHGAAIDERVRYSVLMADLDRFKQFNDTYGHAEGDKALQKVAETMCLAVRESDLVGRLGGEEFAVILPDTCLSAARAVAERIRQEL
jgi:two-component system chemotaxis family response regulator WspR